MAKQDTVVSSGKTPVFQTGVAGSSPVSVFIWQRSLKNASTQRELYKTQLIYMAEKPAKKTQITGGYSYGKN